jgi:hypothetical protein
MRWVFPLYAFFATSGCAGPSPEAPLEPPEREAPGAAATAGVTKNTVNTDPPIPFASGQLTTRWIGLLASSTDNCPIADAGFSTGTLFSPGAPAALKVYCLYESDLAGTPAFLNGVPAGFAMEPDLQVVGAAGLSDVMDGPYEALTTQQIQVVPPQSAGGGGKPRLTLIDTTPTFAHADSPWDQMGYNDHGYVLANIARKYSCDNDGDCVADIHTRLGLHLQMDGSGNIVPNVTDGGDFGSIAFVAKAVRDEVADWSGDNPLILNLSIGWDPDWGGALTSMSTWPLSVRAMYDALEDAACRGVMITVASGNRLGGPPPDDLPLYPAGWGTAQLTVPTCTTQLGAAGSVRILTGDPLLYPVGGVDAYGERLVLSRSNSHPKLVAYGNHAVVRDSSSNPTTILTGTSVSAVVASIAAAAVWDNRTGARPAQVASMLYNSGAPAIQDVAPYWCPTGCGKAKFIDVCQAVKWVCDATSPGYGGTPCARTAISVACDTAAPLIPSPPLAEILTLATTTPDYTMTVSPATNFHSVCGGGTIELFNETNNLAINPCPYDQYHSVRAEPWLHPQPFQEECPACYLSAGTGKIWLELDPDFSTVSSLSLTVTRATGATKTYTTTNVPSSGSSATFTIDPTKVAGAVTAKINIVRSASTQSEASLQVLP